MINEFEAIIDDAEKNMENPDLILAFVLMAFDNNPKIRIQEALNLKKIFDQKQKLSKFMNSSIGDGAIPMQTGMSRAERRALKRMNKKNK